VGEVKQYITVDEFAAKLHICRASVYNHLKDISGFPQPIKVGHSSRWSVEEIDLFMNNAPRGVDGESHELPANE
jgi:predicted DNA-binding transcriptional regulator AlpA